eukprot:2079578-Rhodomonas_salina.1
MRDGRTEGGREGGRGTWLPRSALIASASLTTSATHTRVSPRSKTAASSPSAPSPFMAALSLVIVKVPPTTASINGSPASGNGATASINGSAAREHAGGPAACSALAGSGSAPVAFANRSTACEGARLGQHLSETAPCNRSPKPESRKLNPSR